MTATIFAISSSIAIGFCLPPCTRPGACGQACATGSMYVSAPVLLTTSRRVDKGHRQLLKGRSSWLPRANRTDRGRHREVLVVVPRTHAREYIRRSPLLPLHLHGEFSHHGRPLFREPVCIVDNRDGCEHTSAPLPHPPSGGGEFPQPLVQQHALLFLVLCPHLPPPLTLHQRTPLLGYDPRPRKVDGAPQRTHGDLHRCPRPRLNRQDWFWLIPVGPMIMFFPAPLPLLWRDASVPCWDWVWLGIPLGPPCTFLVCGLAPGPCDGPSAQGCTQDLALGSLAYLAAPC